MDTRWLELSETVEKLAYSHGEVTVLEAFVAHLDHMVQEQVIFDTAAKERLQELVDILTASIQDLAAK